MPQTGPTISPERFDGVLFDLDGVLTDTAKIHASSWKTMFDEFLRRRAEKSGESFLPFDIETDYLHHVDGKPRVAGVRDFLLSRGIELSEAERNDLGARKNALFGEMLESGQVDPYADAIDMVDRLAALGIRMAVVSSSHNCEAVLRAAGIADRFELRVDGGVAQRLDLSGKPAPDTFLAAASQLGIPPERAVVVEDAISGVQAGREGGFGLVVGVARGGDKQALLENGAGLVVDTLDEVST